MDVKLDAILAEIVRTIDVDLVTREPSFGDLWGPNRMHLIIAALVRGGVAKPDESKGGNARRWRATRRLENCAGVTICGIYDQVERHEAARFNTDAVKLSDVLNANGAAIQEVATYVLRCFVRYQEGVLRYHGRRDGLCRFYSPARRLYVREASLAYQSPSTLDGGAL